MGKVVQRYFMSQFMNIYIFQIGEMELFIRLGKYKMEKTVETLSTVQHLKIHSEI